MKRIRGKLLYIPIYSNIPLQIDKVMVDMSAFVALHNTSLNSPLYLIRVLYFNQNGNLMGDFMKDYTIKFDPLSTKNFYIPYEDKSGKGAKFLIEWIFDSLINEPLIESVTINF